jgi:polyhydroxyalkanoate synthase
MARHVSFDPNKMAQSQLNLTRDHLKLWQWWTDQMLGKTASPTVQSNPKDRRFADDGWNSSVFDFIKQNYLINARWLQDMVHNIDGLDAHTAHKLSFFTRQFIDAMAPSNFVFTNPEVMRTMIDSNGDSVVSGLTHLLKDIEKGGGDLRISMTDENAFTLGENIAATPGQVVYENDLMQLIQYVPTTKTVYKTPLLLIPAWINKYYIFDLTAERSYVRWLVEQGYTVFVISWVNPDEKLGRKSFEDYLRQGPLTALDVIDKICGTTKTAIIGYCLGGTLTAIMLSYLRSIGESDRVTSATYLTTLIDFAEAGDIAVFIDETQLDALEARMSERGYLEANEMNTTFNMLRANDLIWSFVVNNYLLGKQHFPFDLLYWNSDSTRMPATMHGFYLRNMYQNNNLIKPGGITLLDTPINLARLTTPSYVLATREDHIAPWTSAYIATQVYDGECIFSLADSGHVAGVINPPVKKKYCYWVNDQLPAKAADWFKSAKQHPGSWWDHWHVWQSKRMGVKVPARKPGSAKYKPIEAAPGRYARVKS